MTLGTKIKKYRVNKKLTQKELADEVCVSYQTVSKWESDINEPDISTLRKLADIFGCTLDELVSEEDIEENKTEVTADPVIIPVPNNVSSNNKATRKVIGTCDDCGETIYEGDEIHHLQRTVNGVVQTKTVCKDCFNDIKIASSSKTTSQVKPLQTAKAKPVQDKSEKILKGITIGVGILAFVIVLIVCIVNYQKIGIGWTIGLPIIAAYFFLSTAYCVGCGSWIADVFFAVAGWSIRFPGIIFSFDMDGLMFLIGMKILFFILGIMFSIGVFLLAIAISGLFSVFAFIPLLIYNKNH